MSLPLSAVVAAVFTVWCGATWLLEGRIQSGLRPDALSERVAYVVVANILIGIVAVAAALRRKTPVGFRRRLPSVPWIAGGVVLGAAMYLGQGAPSREPIVVINAFFFASRDAYATILFHNFLGVFGVVRALAAADQLRSFETPQAPVIALAAIAMATLIAADHFLLGKASPP